VAAEGRSTWARSTECRLAALVGRKKHRDAPAAGSRPGVDILVGNRAPRPAAIAGEVSHYGLLVPKVVIKAIKIYTRAGLAAGGIMKAAQDGCVHGVSMGRGPAHGHGSVWLANSRTNRDIGNLRGEDDRGLLARSCPLQGPHRQARATASCGRYGPTPGTEGPDSPGALPMPCDEHHQPTTPSTRSIAPGAGKTRMARDSSSYFVGQGVGLIDSVKSAGRRMVVQGGNSRRI